MTPRTLGELRAAVARVLVARGESAEALVCDVARRRDGVWIASINAVVCNAIVDWLALGGITRAEALAAIWRRFSGELRAELASAHRSRVACRSRATRDAAETRLRRARAACEAAGVGVGDG